MSNCMQVNLFRSVLLVFQHINLDIEHRGLFNAMQGQIAVDVGACRAVPVKCLALEQDLGKAFDIHEFMAPDNLIEVGIAGFHAGGVYKQQCMTVLVRIRWQGEPADKVDELAAEFLEREMPYTEPDP